MARSRTLCPFWRPACPAPCASQAHSGSSARALQWNRLWHRGLPDSEASGFCGLAVQSVGLAISVQALLQPPHPPHPSRVGLFPEATVRPSGPRGNCARPPPGTPRASPGRASVFAKWTLPDLIIFLALSLSSDDVGENQSCGTFWWLRGFRFTFSHFW